MTLSRREECMLSCLRWNQVCDKISEAVYSEVLGKCQAEGRRQTESSKGADQNIDCGHHEKRWVMLGLHESVTRCNQVKR